MSDLYTELLVKKEKTSKDSMIKIGTIAAVVFLALAGLFIFPLFLIAAIILGVVAYYFILPKTDLEYEYLFVNGEMDIDVIMSQTKRKKAKSFSLSEAELVAPLKSAKMDYYNGNTKMKVYDFSSGNPSHNRFAVITRDKGEACKIIIEPDENLAQLMKNCAPSKVFLI